MASRTIAYIPVRTMAELLDQLGGIPARRVLLTPTPGTATEEDVVAIHDREKRLCELVDGILVEKTMGAEESEYAIWLGYFLITYLKTRRLGRVYGTDGAMRLFPGLIRIPDVSFVSRERWSKAKKAPILDLVPDLAVEILSKSNTKREMQKKLNDYFSAGVRLVWYADPRKRTVRVYEAVDRSVLLGEDDFLEGGDVLPGFRLSIREWFDGPEQIGS